MVCVVSRCHRHAKSCIGKSLLELFQDLVALRRCGVNGNEIIVVKVHAICAHFSEQADKLRRGFVYTDGRAKWVCATIANGP